MPNIVKLQTNFGNIKIELFEKEAPITTQNFISYVQNGFYDNTIFHRVINNFMIQGGGFDTSMTQKESQSPIKNEADNGLSNNTGTVAMARTMEPHSASSQFFINVNDNDFLNFTNPTPQGWGYCVFGKVTEGMDIINQIKTVQTTSKNGHQDVPVEDVIILKAELMND